MLSNKSINIINRCLELTLAITKDKDIAETIKEFNEYITEIEDEQREFEENYNYYIEQ